MYNKKVEQYDQEMVKVSHIRIFDTLQYANKLKAVGVPEKQAEVQAEMMADIVDDKLATKNDLAQVNSDLRWAIEETRSELKRDIEELRTEFKQSMKELELRMTIKLGSLMIGGIGTIVILMKLFKL
jgi:capsule polysaccharide export protein KpsE/RkpR